MEEFTPNELKYIQLLKDMKEMFPRRDVSVVNQPLRTRKELLSTILFHYSFSFNLASDLDFTKKGQLGRRTDIYGGHSYPFWNLTSQREFSDLLCSAIVNYVPELKFPSPETFSPNSSDNIKSMFLQDYKTNIQTLLEGPPHAGEYGIDDEKANAWVAAQKTEERQRLARKLIDNTLYISHFDLLNEIQDCVQKVKNKLEEGPVTFVVGTKDKSNYFVSLLFYHYWNQAGLRLDTVKYFMDEIVNGNVIDIDEAAYSGSQTIQILAHVYGNFAHQFKKKLDRMNASYVMRNTNLVGRTPKGASIKGYYQYAEPVKGSYVKSYAMSKTFLPVCLVEKYLHANKINYILLRVYCSEQGRAALLQMPPPSYSAFGYKDLVNLPLTLVIGKVMPSPATLFGEEDANKLALLFGPNPGYPAAAAYFNHKIANIPSTYMVPYALGVVPERILYDPRNLEFPGLKTKKFVNEHSNWITNLYINPNGTNEKKAEYKPFLHHCSPEERTLPTNLNVYSLTGEMGESLPQKYRCPYPWYKQIDYTTGMYPNIPLPHGPKEENFVNKGGKRKTQKQRRVKRKTRSHSK